MELFRCIIWGISQTSNHFFFRWSLTSAYTREQSCSRSLVFDNLLRIRHANWWNLQGKREGTLDMRVIKFEEIKWLGSMGNAWSDCGWRHGSTGRKEWQILSGGSVQHSSGRGQWKSQVNIWIQGMILVNYGDILEFISDMVFIYNISQMVELSSSRSPKSSCNLAISTFATDVLMDRRFTDSHKKALQLQ